MSVRVCKTLVVLIAFTLFAPTPCAAVGLDGELGMRFESNRTRAEAEPDQENDTAVVLGLNAHERWRLDGLTTLTLEGGLGARLWTRFEDTSQFSLDAGLRVRRRTGISYDAPWVETVLRLTGLKHQDSEVRDGGILRAGVTAGKRFGHRYTARLGYAHVIRRAVEDKVFDTEHHEVFAQLDFQWNARWLWYAEIGLLTGEITSVASLPNPRIRSAANAVLRDFDDAFGRGPSPVVPGLRPRWTYQLDADVLSAELGVNYPLRPGLALDVAARYLSADAAGDNRYSGYIVNAGLLWQFD